MIPFGLFDNRNYIMHAVSNAMPAGMTGEGLKPLLDILSNKELKVLRLYEDLREQVAKISRMNAGELIKVVEDRFGLEVSHTHVDSDLWIGFEDDLEALQPKWIKYSHFGWYLTVEDGEFATWARDMLMQEVRVNIWMRYLRHKRKSKKERDDEDFLPGMYL